MYGLSLCGILFNGNKSVVLSGGFVVEDLYKQLEFKQPQFLENPYGIRIYIGTKGKDDWCVVIPKKLAKMQCRYYNCDNVYFLISLNQRQALRIC